CRLRCTSSCRNGGLIELAEHIVDVNDIAFVLGALGQNAGFEGGYFYCNLVGLELDQRIARGNGITLLLLPARNRGFNDRLAERRNFYGEHSEIRSDRKSKSI